MRDTYTSRSHLEQSSTTKSPESARHPFPELVDDDRGFGRAYPTCEPLSIFAALRRWFSP